MAEVTTAATCSTESTRSPSSSPSVHVISRNRAWSIRVASRPSTPVDPMSFPTLDRGRSTPDRGTRPRPRTWLLWAALAEALVYYYPVAGRLRKLPGCRSRGTVDCTAEGVVFVEAHADVRLEEFGTPLVPPYPCVDELLCDVGDTRDIIGKPLLYLQMTQLAWGSFVLGLTICHCLTDAIGGVQILRCMLDIARGQTIPAVLPLWERHLLVSSVPQVASDDTAAMVDADDKVEPMMQATATPPAEEMVTRSFLFGPREIAALRSSLPACLGQSATVFELITAAVWRCRVAALMYAPDDQVYVLFSLNARGSWKSDPPLPPGFYGNAVVTTTANATAGELCRATLAHAVELVHEAKLRVTDEYMRSVLDLMATGELHLQAPLDMTFVVSDVTRCGDDSLDLGWAKRVGGGLPMAGDIMARLPSFYMSCKDANGDKCVVVPKFLPELAMERFASQIAAATNGVTGSLI